MLAKAYRWTRDDVLKLSPAQITAYMELMARDANRQMIEREAAKNRKRR